MLAKGGLTIFSGRPQLLRSHLNECQIICNENQVPIEILMKVGANGFDNEEVIRLSDKTNRDLIPFNLRTDKELKLFPDGIPQKIKKFSFEESKHLLMRYFVYTLRFNWILLFGFIISETMCALFARVLFDEDLERPDSCVDISTNMTSGCVRDSQQLEDLKLLAYNMIFLSIGQNIPSLLVTIYTSFTFSSEVKLFTAETRNCKFINFLPWLVRELEKH